MYKEIASNKRRTLAVIVSFLVIWLAIGVVAGLLFKALYQSARTKQPSPSPRACWPS
jgi:predicted cobalt transporter CbtA